MEKLDPSSIQLDELYLLSQRYLTINNKPYQRELISLKKPWQHRLAILIGQRGVGKTTLIVQYLLTQTNGDIFNKNILYVPVDHFLLRGRSLYELADTFVKFSGKIIAFDEIHKYPFWSEELKSIYDTFPELKVIASGSSALKIYQGSHDLTRRAVTVPIHGLSFREYLNLLLEKSFPQYSLSDILKNHQQYSDEIIKKCQPKKMLALFNDYLRHGYYPYYFELNNEDLYFITLEQNFHTVIESDLVAIHPALTGKSIRKIKHLLNFIASSVPFIPQMSKLKNIVGVGDERTLKEYLKYLEDAELIRMIMPATKKMHKIESPEKIYLNNPNQIYAITSSKLDHNIGTIREIFFVNMLSSTHEVTAAKTGDFLINGKIVFEIGGRGKNFEQIKNEKHAFLALDEIEHGIDRKIPLWLFGFLY